MGYEFLEVDGSNTIARMLNFEGIAAYVLDYRVAPCHRLAPFSDAARAIRLVRSFGYEKVGILGFSAGGNLCCCAAVHYDRGDPAAADPVERLSSRPDVFIPCYPVTILRSALTASVDTGGIQSTTDDVITHTRKVLDTAASDHDDRVLLQVVAFTGDVAVDLFLVGQTNPGNLSHG